MNTSNLPTVSNISKVQKIIVHGDLCADGRGSALILKEALPNASIVFVGYGTTEHTSLKPEENMLFCDFSPHRDNWEAFLEAGAIVLDHHKGASDIVQKFEDKGLGIYADNESLPGVSGASLAYHAVRPLLAVESQPLETLATLCGIRDTWVKGSPLWMVATELATALSYFPQSYVMNDDPIAQKLALFQEIGKLQVQKHQESVLNALSKAFYFESQRGTKAVIISGTSLTSDASDIAEADLLIGFSFSALGEVGSENQSITLSLSTRSRKGYPCMELAQHYGGGGHPQAAGCKVPLSLTDSNPYAKIVQMVDSFEASIKPPEENLQAPTLLERAGVYLNRWGLV